MAHRQDGESGSINRRDTGTVLTDYRAWLGEQPLSARTREAYLAARDHKRHMKVDRGLSPASVNQALAGPGSPVSLPRAGSGDRGS